MNRFYQLLLALSIIALASATRRTTVVCRASKTSVTQCPVLYNETAVLVCPVFGYWSKNGSSSYTHAYNYTLPQESSGPEYLSFTRDSGIYYCQESSTAPNYTVNVIVQGPPEFVSFGDQAYVPSSHRYPLITLEDPNSFINITVKVVGVGPFKVSWTLNDSTQDACSRATCTNDTINETSTIFTYQLSYPYSQSMEGWYKASVSNHIGSNHAEIYAQYKCSTPGSDPVPLKPSSLVENMRVTQGTEISLSCVAYMYDKNNYGICYGNKNETFPHSVLGKPGRCVYCNQGDLDCTVDLDKEVAMVTGLGRYNSTSCHYNGVVLNVTSYEKMNDTTFYCYWKVYNNVENGTFAQYHIIVDQPPSDKSPYMITISSTGGGVVLIVVAVVVIILIVLIVRKQRRSVVGRSPTIYVQDEADNSGMYSPEAEENQKLLSPTTCTTQSLRRFPSYTSVNPSVAPSLGTVHLPPPPNSEEYYV